MYVPFVPLSTRNRQTFIHSPRLVNSRIPVSLKRQKENQEPTSHARGHARAHDDVWMCLGMCVSMCGWEVMERIGCLEQRMGVCMYECMLSSEREPSNRQKRRRNQDALSSNPTDLKHDTCVLTLLSSILTDNP